MGQNLITVQKFVGKILMGHMLAPRKYYTVQNFPSNTKLFLKQSTNAALGK